MTARSFGQVVGGYGQRKSKANPQAPTDPVRAHSYDVDDPRAQPGRRVGDGTAKEGWAFKNALTATLEQLYEDQRKRGFVGEWRVQATHLHIFKVMLAEFLFVRNGDFYASARAIGEKAGESETTVKRCIRVLEYWGFLCHVRRSRLVKEREGLPGWQRETASNAYYFDCRNRMPTMLWKLFWRKLVANLKHVRKLAIRAAHVIAATFNNVAKPAPREPSTELRMKLARLAHAIDQRDRSAPSRPECAGSAAPA